MKYKKGDIICLKYDRLTMHRVAIVDEVGSIFIGLRWCHLKEEEEARHISQYSSGISNRKLIEERTEKVGQQLGPNTSYICGAFYKMSIPIKQTDIAPKYDDTAVI